MWSPEYGEWSMEYGVWRIDYTFGICSVERQDRRQGVCGLPDQQTDSAARCRRSVWLRVDTPICCPL